MFGLRKEDFDGKSKMHSASFDCFRLLSDEGVDNRTLVAHDTLNCNLRGGMLCTGLGLKIHYVGNSTSPVVLRDTLQRIYTFDRATMVTHAREFEGMCFYTSKGNLGLVELDGTSYVLSDTFTGVPHMATVVGQSNQVYTVFTSKGFFYHGEIGAWRKYTLENGLTPVCACKDRLFIAYNTRSIRYSDVYDQRLEDRTLEGGGSIHLPYGFGEIKAMVALDNKVYVFEQYGAVCIDVQGSPKDFVVTPLDYHGGEIYGDSVGVHQGMIWFLAEDGVHRFNGNRFESVAEFLKIRPSVTNKECGFGFCGEYYILQYQDLRQGVRRSVAIHEDGKSGYFISDREALSYGYGRTLCKNNSHEICYLAENGSLAYNESYFFESQRTDLGIVGRKTVRKIRVEGEGNITLYLRTGLRQCAVQGKITNGVLEHKVRLRGDEFSFYIVLNGGACVRSVRVDFETVA